MSAVDDGVMVSEPVHPSCPLSPAPVGLDRDMGVADDGSCCCCWYCDQEVWGGGDRKMDERCDEAREADVESLLSSAATLSFSSSSCEKLNEALMTVGELRLDSASAQSSSRRWSWCSCSDRVGKKKGKEKAMRRAAC